MRTLEQQPLIELKVLFNVNEKSPFYTGGEQTLVFYAESWALVHMLSVSQEYAPAFHKFVSLINKGSSAASAFNQIYGRSVLDIQAALQAYLPSLPCMSTTLYTPNVEGSKSIVSSSLLEEGKSDFLFNDAVNTIP